MDTKSIKVGIVSSIIASIIVIVLINPILSFVWHIVVATVGSIHEGYVDQIYVRAAVFDGGSQTAVIGLATFLMIMVAAAQFVFLLRWSGESIYRRRQVYTVAVAFWMTLVIILSVPLSIFRGIVRIEASFNQRLTILAPAITDGEYKSLKARWASMHSKAEYDTLGTAMDKRAAELGVTLPPVRNP